MSTEQEHGEFVWHNGELIPWADARIHVMSHVVNYGSSVFEGIRCYNTKKGSAIFRLDAHVERLLDSAHIYRMNVPYTTDDFREARCELWFPATFDQSFL